MGNLQTMTSLPLLTAKLLITLWIIQTVCSMDNPSKSKKTRLSRMPIYYGKRSSSHLDRHQSPQFGSMSNDQLLESTDNDKFAYNIKDIDYNNRRSSKIDMYLSRNPLLTRSTSMRSDVQKGATRIYNLWNSVLGFSGDKNIVRTTTTTTTTTKNTPGPPAKRSHYLWPHTDPSLLDKYYLAGFHDFFNHKSSFKKRLPFLFDSISHRKRRFKYSNNNNNIIERTTTDNFDERAGNYHSEYGPGNLLSENGSRFHREKFPFSAARFERFLQKIRLNFSRFQKMYDAIDFKDWSNRQRFADLAWKKRQFKSTLSRMPHFYGKRSGLPERDSFGLPERDSFGLPERDSFGFPERDTQREAHSQLTHSSPLN